MENDRSVIKIEDIDTAPEALALAPNFDYRFQYEQLKPKFDEVTEKLLTSELLCQELKRKEGTRALLDSLMKEVLRHFCAIRFG